MRNPFWRLRIMVRRWLGLDQDAGRVEQMMGPVEDIARIAYRSEQTLEGMQGDIWRVEREVNRLSAAMTAKARKKRK